LFRLQFAPTGVNTHFLGTSAMHANLSQVISSATPSDMEIAAWKALPRDEQLRRLREELSRPEACVAGQSDMVDIWAKIRAHRQSR